MAVSYDISEGNDDRTSTGQRDSTEQEKGKVATNAVSFRRQFRVLTSRTFKITIRYPLGVAGSLLEAVGMAVINGWIFVQLDESQAGIRSWQGSLYIASSLNGYLILLYETYRLTIDIQLFDRERAEGVVGVPAFLLSRRAARLPLEDLPVPVIFAVMFYFMVGYRVDAGQFFIFLAITVLTHYIASFACRYYVQANQIPVYVCWLKWVAYSFFIFGSLCANELIGPNGPPKGQFYKCPYSNNPDDPRCTQYTGRYIMDSLGLPSNWIWRLIVVQAAFVIGHYLLAALLLQYNRFAMSIAQAHKTEDKDLSAGKEKIAVRPAAEQRRVAISLDKYSLDIRKRDVLKQRPRTLSILKTITAEFQPGKLNVIMGPSGSGKTTLLNSIANRLHSSLDTQYRVHGTMLYNSAVPAESVIRSVTSFVTQDDDALMPSLTVRESLRFAAGLRLPQYMTRAEEILLRMSLKECANNLIGSDLIKGISGGEKRRVTIAIQILTDPKVLLLDEPTSGLDPFTAMSITEVLEGLAREGRTLIMTIHQARSDLFQRFFSNVLLLARGGSPVYAGEGAKMLPYFGELEHECPQTTNPADFVLDLITVDLQQDDREAVTRSRVQNLITQWEQNQPPLLQREPSQIATPAELGSLRREMLPLRITDPLALHRSAINFWRQPPLVMARPVQILGIAEVMALFFAPLKNDYAAVQSRMGFIQEFAALYFGMLQNIAIYPNERDVFYREHADKCYSVETFLLQHTTLEIPFEIISSLAFGAVAAYADNLTHRMLLPSAFNCFCIISSGESVGIAFCTLFSHAGFAVNVTSILLAISTVLGGVMSLRVDSMLQGINRLSPIKYAIANLAPDALRGQRFGCSGAQRLADGRCPIENGKQVLDSYCMA